MPLRQLGWTAAALALCLVIAPPVWAENQASTELKTRIDELLGKLEVLSQGVVKWEGAGRLEIRDDYDAATADITEARISFGSPEAKPGASRVQVELDHIAVRYAPAPDGAIALSIVLPPRSVLRAPDGDEIEIALTDATTKAVLDAKSFRARESSLAFAGARIGHKKSGDWAAFGPLSLSYAVVNAADGSWTAPIDFELKRSEFFFAEGPVAGTVDRIGYNAKSAGPDFAAMNRLRDRMDALRQQGDIPAEARLEALLGLLPTIPSLFSLAKGELVVEGAVVRPPTGQAFFTLAKASIGGALSGLSGDAAALRITLKHDGLVLAPSLLAAGKVPRRAVVDFGLEEVATGPLRSIIEALAKQRMGAADAGNPQAMQQMIGAAAMLNPVFRIYDLAIDTPDAGLEATAEARGSPLSPKGYTAQGDVTVRGFDALATLIDDPRFLPYLAVLKEIGTAATAGGGAARLKFHLASAPPKWITINGGDVSAWLGLRAPAAGEPRLLRPQHPAMTGDDVSAVQRALAAAKIAAPQGGAYDAATAGAVARFQKQNGLNVDGAVDSATRQKLGVKAEPPRPADPQPRPATPGGR